MILYHFELAWFTWQAQSRKQSRTKFNGNVKWDAHEEGVKKMSYAVQYFVQGFVLGQRICFWGYAFSQLATKHRAKQANNQPLHGSYKSYQDIRHMNLPLIHIHCFPPSTHDRSLFPPTNYYKTAFFTFALLDIYFITQPLTSGHATTPPSEYFSEWHT